MAVICLVALTAMAQAPRTPDATSAKGPLRIHPHNPRYFTDGIQQPDGSLEAVCLSGSHTWNNLVDMGRNDPPEPFDFESYLKFLRSHGHNFIQLCAWDSTTWATRFTGALGKDFVHKAAPLPWTRTSPGKALDGKPKFDLTQFAAEDFQRLRTRFEAAGQQGIYVSVMLFKQTLEWDETTDLGLPAKLGVFRLDRDGLARKPGLVLVDFTASDGFDSGDPETLLWLTH